jgi:hypothetical protein
MYDRLGVAWASRLLGFLLIFSLFQSCTERECERPVRELDMNLRFKKKCMEGRDDSNRLLRDLLIRFRLLDDAILSVYVCLWSAVWN